VSLISHDGEWWRLNAINAGPPYHVALVGPWALAQVEDALGTVALVGPHGAVFCATRQQAEQLCVLANAGLLDSTSCDS